MQQTSLMTMHDGVGIAKPENSCFDWQQLYWEAHLQKYAHLMRVLDISTLV